MNTPGFMIRFPRDLVNRLKKAAHVESLACGVDMSWVGLLKKLAERYLSEQQAPEEGQEGR